MTDSVINDVSDTAIWVATYRVWETERPDALFRDPLAGRLVGDRGQKIHNQMSNGRYVYWSVVTRTCIIDRFIEKLLQEGVDAVINLGCGLDTRPYRMTFPASLRWIEVDFPHMIAFKEEKLKGEKPRCRLERIGLDLSKTSERRDLFKKLNGEVKKALILTEGVTPYLTNEAVGALAEDLRQQSQFKYWITDYNSPHLMKYMNGRRRRREMKNAPFVFNPPDWTQFFGSRGWKEREARYIGEESEKLGRPIPVPWIAKIMMKLFMPPKKKAEFKRYNGYVLLEPR